MGTCTSSMCCVQDKQSEIIKDILSYNSVMEQERLKAYNNSLNTTSTISVVLSPGRQVDAREQHTKSIEAKISWVNLVLKQSLENQSVAHKELIHATEELDEEQNKSSDEEQKWSSDEEFRSDGERRKLTQEMESLMDLI